MGCNFSAALEPEEDVAAVQQQQQQQHQQPQESKSDQKPSGFSKVTATPTATKTSKSGIHDHLPAGAEKHTVRNVYDGDTLTLIDERRVRLLGIDTPEIKQQQAFAQEAKKYTKDLCHKKDIWISYDANGDKKDHYGRLLAFVWVVAPDGPAGSYLCVNEGIVSEGFARVYTPNKDSQTHNFQYMLELQTHARKNRIGLWQDFREFQVYATANGAAYHKADCKHIHSIRNKTEMGVGVALDEGLHPCRTCLAD